MKDILTNLALLATTSFCKENDIDCSGTHIIKDGRGFNYSLVKSDSGAALITVSYHKSSVPTYLVHDAAYKEMK